MRRSGVSVWGRGRGWCGVCAGVGWGVFQLKESLGSIPLSSLFPGYRSPPPPPRHRESLAGSLSDCRARVASPAPPAPTWLRGPRAGWAAGGQDTVSVTIPTYGAARVLGRPRPGPLAIGDREAPITPRIGAS